jgi:hypothetical protein
MRLRRRYLNAAYIFFANKAAADLPTAGKKLPAERNGIERKMEINRLNLHLII